MPKPLHIEAVRQIHREAAALLKDQYQYMVFTDAKSWQQRAAAMDLVRELMHRADEPPFKCACDGCEYRAEILAVTPREQMA
jgi:hypothetical protein